LEVDGSAAAEAPARRRRPVCRVAALRAALPLPANFGRPKIDNWNDRSWHNSEAAGLVNGVR